MNALESFKWIEENILENVQLKRKDHLALDSMRDVIKKAILKGEKDGIHDTERSEDQGSNTRDS